MTKNISEFFQDSYKPETEFQGHKYIFSVSFTSFKIFDVEIQELEAI